MIDKALQKYKGICDIFSSQKSQYIKNVQSFGVTFVISGILMMMGGLLSERFQLIESGFINFVLIGLGASIGLTTIIFYNKIENKINKQKEKALKELNLSIFEQLKSGTIKELSAFIHDDTSRILLRKLATNILENKNQQDTMGLLQQIKNTTLEKDKNKAVDDFLRKNNLSPNPHHQLMEML